MFINKCINIGNSQLPREYNTRFPQHHILQHYNLILGVTNRKYAFKCRLSSLLMGGHILMKVDYYSTDGLQSGNSPDYMLEVRYFVIESHSLPIMRYLNYVTTDIVISSYMLYQYMAYFYFLDSFILKSR